MLERPARYTIKTMPRGAREDHKTPIVIARQFETIRLKEEEVVVITCGGKSKIDITQGGCRSTA